MLIVLAIIWFIGPWIVMMGYNAIKFDFNLPDLNYWQFFWATNAIHTLIGKTSVKNAD